MQGINVKEHLKSLYLNVLEITAFDNVKQFKLGEKMQRARKEQQQLKVLESCISTYTDSRHQLIARVLLTNELNWLNTSHHNEVLEWDLTLLLVSAVIKRFLILDDIISIQPMRHPTSAAYWLGFEDDAKSILSVLTTPIEANTHEFQTGVSHEAIHDCKTLFTPIEDLIEVLSEELAYEIINEVICDLVTLAKLNPNSKHIQPTDQHNLRVIFGQHSKIIADSTHRGFGHTIITTTEGLSVLQRNFSFVPTSHTDSTDNSLHHVGCITFDDIVTYKVYNTISSALVDENIKEIPFLMLYNGKESIDTGYVFSPYIVLMRGKDTINPITFQPSTHFIMRSGKSTRSQHITTELESTNIAFGSSSDFYILLTLTND